MNKPNNTIGREGLCKMLDSLSDEKLDLFLNYLRGLHEKEKRTVTDAEFVEALDSLTDEQLFTFKGYMENLIRKGERE